LSGIGIRSIGIQKSDGAIALIADCWGSGAGWEKGKGPERRRPEG